MTLMRSKIEEEETITVSLIFFLRKEGFRC